MANNVEKLFNDAIVFKRTHLEYSDLDLFFEFDTIKKLDEYPEHDWGFIIIKILKIFSCDENGLCSIILYDVLESQKINGKVWKSVFNSLQQAWKNKDGI